jgi:hypothetical protein
MGNQRHVELLFVTSWFPTAPPTNVQTLDVQKSDLVRCLNEFLRHTVQDILTTRCAANRDAKVALFEVGSHPKIHDAKQLDLFC